MFFELSSTSFSKENVSERKEGSEEKKKNKRIMKSEEGEKKVGVQNLGLDADHFISI